MWRERPRPRGSDPRPLLARAGFDNVRFCEDHHNSRVPHLCHLLAEVGFHKTVYAARFCRVATAFFAALFRPTAPFVRTAFCAACLRAALPRRLAACFACRESAFFDAALRGWRFRAFSVARERFADGFFLRALLCPLR